ncbi:hemerythrin-like domain-containing protein [Rhodoblastus acidophilus]|uniref:hemerythrin domain-containing protein n=1 Tax=Rhodoblastus acidophilus TaxID=1074 RepID=UPI0022241F93|nr:hemerythrin domain-containing protein [Rhodoblastus acidophilus]MCW2284829.1 hemerythrin-like domain-containing protein [Rhodoblastus acidophilus]MCW2333881.1 hemerythrin-like domain-containing protein [Rhodoblastus acidophilus]
MFANRISQTLHEEHSATIELMERLEAMIPRKTPLDAKNPLLRDLAAAIEADTIRHFDFEEQHLFPMLASVGDQLIGDHLTEEHNFMRPVAERLKGLCDTAQQTGFDEESWKQFQRAGAEFVQRMLIHVQKEEMALLPLIDGTMDSATEERLFEVYAG